MAPRKNSHPVHPGGVLKKLYLDPFELTISDLAEAIGISERIISKLIDERGSVTPKLARRLSAAFETTPDLWLNLQKNYDDWQAQQIDALRKNADKN